MGRSRKPLCVQTYRGFESHSLLRFFSRQLVASFSTRFLDFLKATLFQNEEISMSHKFFSHTRLFSAKCPNFKHRKVLAPFQMQHCARHLRPRNGSEDQSEDLDAWCKLDVWCKSEHDKS